MLLAKDNQARLLDDLRLFFTKPPQDCRDWRTARTVDKGHGRLEIRELVGVYFARKVGSRTGLVAVAWCVGK